MQDCLLWPLGNYLNEQCQLTTKKSVHLHNYCCQCMVSSSFMVMRFFLTMTDIDNFFYKAFSYYLWRQTHMDFIHAPLVFTGVLTHLTVFPCSLNLLNIVQCVSIEWTWINNLWCLKNNKIFDSSIRYPRRKAWHLYILYSALSSVFMAYSKVLCLCVYMTGVSVCWHFTVKNNIVNSTMAS